MKARQSRCVWLAAALVLIGLGSVGAQDVQKTLPFQTVATMADTLEKTLDLRPDRVAFYRLAVIPEMFRWQGVFRPSDLPAGTCHSN